MIQSNDQRIILFHPFKNLGQNPPLYIYNNILTTYIYKET